MEKVDFEILDGEMWAYLHQRYGGMAVKRLAVERGKFYSSVQTRYLRIEIIVLAVSSIYSGAIEEALSQKYIVQVEEGSTLMQASARIASCIGYTLMNN